MNKPVIIVGNGGHASVIAEILTEQNRKILGFTAPDEQKNELGLIYLGTDENIEAYDPQKIEIVNCIGSSDIPEKRRDVFHFFKSRGYSFASVLHPTAIISSSVHLGEGVHVMAGAIIQTRAIVNENTLINTAVSIDHHCYIAEHCHVAPGVTLSGNVRIGKVSHIGVGSTVIQNIQIGSHVVIGAGSLIIRNVRKFHKAYGVPAKEVE